MRTVLADSAATSQAMILLHERTGNKATQVVARDLPFSPMATGWRQRTSSGCSVPPCGPGAGSHQDQICPIFCPILVFPATSISF